MMNEQNEGPRDLLDEYKAPFHKGHFPLATHCQMSRNPLCGDQVLLQVQIGNSIVQDAWFDGQGCVVSQAAASLLCRWLPGESLTSIASVTTIDFLKRLPVPLSPARQRCGLLAFDALRQILPQIAPEATVETS